GTGLALLFARGAGNPTLAASAVAGLGYGLVWWLFGAMFLMPVRLGLDRFMWNPMPQRGRAGHAVYGLLLGVVYAAVLRRARRGWGAGQVSQVGVGAPGDRRPEIVHGLPPAAGPPGCAHGLGRV